MCPCPLDSKNSPESLSSLITFSTAEEMRKSIPTFLWETLLFRYLRVFFPQTLVKKVEIFCPSLLFKDSDFSHWCQVRTHWHNVLKMFLFPSLQDQIDVIPGFRGCVGDLKCKRWMHTYNFFLLWVALLELSFKSTDCYIIILFINKTLILSLASIKMHFNTNDAFCDHL